MSNKYLLTHDGRESVELKIQQLKAKLALNSSEDEKATIAENISELEEVLMNGSVVSVNAAGNKHQLTVDGYIEMNNKLFEMKNVTLPQIIVALQEARAQGDLSENAEYDAARDEQARIVNEISKLEDDLKNFIIIGDSKTNNLGRRITVLYLDDNEEYEFVLVGSSLEVNPLEDRISKDSPLGKGVLEAKVNDVVTIKPENGTELKVKLLKIEEKK